MTRMEYYDIKVVIEMITRVDIYEKEREYCMMRVEMQRFTKGNSRMVK